ncbi:MAG: hypothetical protein PVH61_24625 [Candidatus Aminicenantes bacterium]|jgi:hypothetical protein
MNWSKILSGVLIGAILGIAGIFFTFNERLVRLDEKIKQLESKLDERINSSETKPTKPRSNSDIEKDFDESFDSDQRGWGEGNTEGSDKKWYFDKEGKYIIANSKNVAVDSVSLSHSVSIPPLHQNSYIELKSIWDSGNPGNKFGLLFKLDNNNQYYFSATKYGYGSVWLKKNKKFKEIITMALR